MMKNILMIAYYFPPLGGSGSLRPLKLAKYFPSFGWNPIVFSVKNPNWYYAHDHELLNELYPGAKIFRSWMINTAWLYWILNPLRNRKFDELIRKFFIHPDDQVGWIPFAYFSIMKIVRKFKISAIYSTSGPISCHLIANLVKAKTDLPWIAEFRDEWFENPDLNLPTKFHRNFHYKIEEKIVRNADKVITMAPIFGEMLSKHSKQLNKFVTITAGWDPDDFTFVDTNVDSKTTTQKFVVAFTGMFYRTFVPDSFLLSIHELIEDGLVSPEKIEILFVGANNKNEISYEDPFKICNFTGFVPRKKSLSCLKGANALLLLLSNKRGKNVIPSKTFEYIASSIPVLALVPGDGDVSNIIRKTKTGIVVEFGDIAGIKKAFLKYYNNWKEKKSKLDFDYNEIAQYNLKNITKQFVNVLNNVSEKN